MRSQRARGGARIGRQLCRDAILKHVPATAPARYRPQAPSRTREAAPGHQAANGCAMNGREQSTTFVVTFRPTVVGIDPIRAFRAALTLIGGDVRAVEEVSARWRDAGREVICAAPRPP